MKYSDRRDFLTGGSLALGAALVASRVSFGAVDIRSTAGTVARRRPRFVFIIMRGALDGLAAVPPYGDPDYAQLRRELAFRAPGAPDGLFALNALFGLHPSLRFMHESFTAREMLVFHAIASPYRERSHFDGQDVLESGCVRPHAVQTGWLNRALTAFPVPRGSGREPDRDLGVALGQNVPLVMRGPATVTSWAPSQLAALDDDTLQRVTDLYASDPLLAKRLAAAMAADAIATSAQPGMESAQTLQEMSRSTNYPNRGAAARYTEVMGAAAGFLRREDGPQLAVVDTAGWDTHANEGSAQGQLAGRLAALDSGLQKLKQQLGSVWSDTVVLLATEFGRTAAVNGTRGTDHGTGTAAFLIGGAVNGGRLIADWPGLSAKALFQQRDLRPTLDLRSVLKGVLMEHLLIPSPSLDLSVFPDSQNAKALTGLVRT